jgi:hypothetical protein
MGTNPMVYEVGQVSTLEGMRIHVGVDHDSVRIRGGGLLSPAQAEVFAQLFVRAVWQAGEHARALADQ